MCFSFFLTLFFIINLIYWILFSMFWIDKGHNVDAYLLFGFFLLFILIVLVFFKYFRSRCRTPLGEIDVEAIPTRTAVADEDTNLTDVNIRRCDAMLDINNVFTPAEQEENLSNWPFLDEKSPDDLNQ